MSENYHVLPLNDLKPHTDTGIHCACQPVVSENHGNSGHTLVIHNAYDGREFAEMDNAIPKGH